LIEEILGHFHYRIKVDENFVCLDLFFRMDETLSLKSLGLSDVCLASLAAEGSLLPLPHRCG
jgi:hypothetical protein